MRVLIKSTTPRFRRAGIEFNAKGVELDLDTLTEAQVDAIYKEPRLTVALLEVPSQPATREAGTGDDGAAVTSNPAGASAPAGAKAAPAAKPGKTPKAAKPKAA